MTDTSVADTKPPASAANELLNSPPPAPAFYESFEDAGVKEWATKAGFKSAEDVAKLAHKFDGFKDADPAELVRIGKDAKPEDTLKILRERFGAPENGADYKLTEIKEVDKPTAEWAQGVFAEAGLTPWQAQLIAAKQMEFVKAGTERLVAEDKAIAEREIAELQSPKGWGANFEANRELARRAFKAAGVDDKTIDYLQSGMGVTGVMKLGLFFGQFIKEGSFVDGNPTGAPQPQGMGAGLLESYRQTDANMRR